MARLRSGILGNIRGKVAGVVGGQWKDKNYIREYVKPAFTESDSQIVQRNLFKNCVLFCKTLVGPVFNAYTDIFIKTMSGFNQFVKTNLTYFTATPSYSSVKVTEGKLHPTVVSKCVIYYDPLKATITYDTGIGNNGSNTDKVFACLYYAPTEQWYFPSAEVTRIDGEIEITIPAGLTETGFHSWTWPVKYVNTIVNMIGTSSYKQGEAA